MRPALILDVDGTVWAYGRLIPGVAEALRRLRNDGHPLLFLSNNPIPPEAYAGRLIELGVPVKPSDILTCLTILERELAVERGARLCVVADDRLEARLAERHPIAADPASIDIVVATGPYDLTYDRLKSAFLALRQGAHFWATNADPLVLGRSEGEAPHTAAVIGALQGCSGRRVERMTGKPSLLSAQAALERLGCGPDEVIVVGDGLDTDIALGHNAGLRSVLVLSGVTRRGELNDSPLQPDFVLDSLASLPRLLRQRIEG